MPGERVNTIEENTKYFIYNTTYTPGVYPKRWGFVYYDGAVKTYGGAVPETFNTNDEDYLFTVSNNGDDTWTLTSVGQEMEVGYSYIFTPWTEADDDLKDGAYMRNGDTIYVANDSITVDDKVWLIYDDSEGKYWNGNNWNAVGANSFALWNTGHPYAIYTAIEKTTVTVVYNLLDENDGFIDSKEVEQLPNSPVSIPTDLISNSGYSPLGYNFTPSIENIGESNCEVDVKVTLKEGVVTNLDTQLSNNKAYTLTTRRGSLGTNGTRVTTNTTGENIKSFAIIKYDEDRYLWSIEDSMWVKFDGTITEDVGEDIAKNSKLVITADEVRNDVLPLFFMGVGSNGLNTNGGGHVAVNDFVTRDDGNEFVIIESGDFDPTEALASLDSYFNPEYWVTYVVKDEAGKVLFEEKNIPTTEGKHITTLPAAYQRSLFYEYDTLNITISETYTTAEFTATQKADAPFLFTTDKTDPMWYFLKLKDSAYPTYEADGDPNVISPTDLVEDETTQWAFIGSPYDGFQIVNKAAGTDLVLGSESALGESGEGDGDDVYATLAAEGSQPFEIWTIQASSYYTNGFFIRNAEGHALNLRSNVDLAYWTGGADSGSTFVVMKVLSGEEKIAEAQKQLNELRASATEVQIGYPTADALDECQAAINDAAEAYRADMSDEATLTQELAYAIENVKDLANVNYTPRTDVYYTITNTRGSIVYNPEKTENVDGDGNEFLWYTTKVKSDSTDHQWGIYEKEGVYYLYNVGKKQFASVTKKAAEGKTIFSSGCWIFSNVPASIEFNGGDDYDPWVAAPSVHIQGTCEVTEVTEEEEEEGYTYEETFSMSISPSYTGPVITYYGVNDGGIPMTFAIATTTQDPEVTAAIEALLDPSGIETIHNSQFTIGNGAIYNLQGQKVKKATKGIYIQNGRKVIFK